MPPERARPPGMYDVARLAGVSHQTVSRVINAHPNVAAETRRRVELAIAELGYRRNTAARALVTRHSNTIGVITSVSAHWGPSTTLIGVEMAARDAGFFVSVAGLNSMEPKAVRDVINHFADQGVEGIVVIAPEAAMAHVTEPFVTDIPLVMVAAGIQPERGVLATAIDQELGAVLATAHLADLGHTRIGHVAGPDPWFDAIERVKGWRRELRSRQLRPGPLLRGDWSAESGYRLGQTLRRRGNPPTAMFIANDLMAIGFIRAMYEAGIRVPEDMSVVGFDDIPGVSHLIPSLTTVRQDLLALGHQCIDILLAEFNRSPGHFPPIKPVLVVRDSAQPV
ncbi:MAG TPA: LacI family DNA-binding transcriptional regulator [Mycobacterium sp.]